MNLREALQTIYDQRGTLTPALVVDEARNQQHPLHERFEWDDGVAGEAYRRDQAHRLITSVRLVYRDDAVARSDVRAFVAVPSHSAQPTYVPVEEAFSDELTARIVLHEFERALTNLQRRYGHLKEYSELLRKSLAESEAA